jgi:tRNA nucleotidyltransferase (CCA-adding enzyme)
LRLLRFSARFGFTIDPAVEKAMADERIGDALLKKVSRERVGIEISKALSAKFPENALLRIAKLGLEDVVFITDQIKDSDIPAKSGELASMVKSTRALFDAQDKLHSTLQNVIKDEMLSPMLWMCCALSKWADVCIMERKHSVPAAFLIVKDGLKLGNDAANRAKSVLGVRNSIINFTHDLEAHSRKDLGLLIRRCGSEWPLAILHALIKDYNTRGESVLERYNALIRQVEEKDLSSAWNLQVLLDGTQIQHALGLQRGGPAISRAKEMLIEYQLANPDADAVACTDYIVSIRSTILNRSK